MKKLGKNLSVVKESVEAYTGIGICICGCGCSCGSGSTVYVYINSATSSSYNSSFGKKW